jgi:hypothetical protein
MRGALGVVEGGTVRRGLLAGSLLIVLALLPSLAVVVSACGEPTQD